jgi:hypothetical protein
MHPDAQPLTDAQRRKLSEMMYWAFLEMRLLGWSNKAQQAADLADAFHNLPNGMWQDDFSLKFFRDCFVAAYQQKYPENRVRDYLTMVDEVISMKG